MNIDEQTAEPKDIAERLDEEIKQRLVKEDNDFQKLGKEISEAERKSKLALGDFLSTEATHAPQQAENAARWQWFLALGVLLLVLGLAGTALVKVVSILAFGPMLLASSLFQLVVAFFTVRWNEQLRHIAAAGPEALLGFVIMAHPVPVMTDLVVLIAIFLMLSGLLRLVRSSMTKSSSQGWTLMAGVAALVLGICIWLQLPVAGLWFVGLCLAFDFICHGASWSALALAERKLLQNRSVVTMPSAPFAGDGN